MAYLGSKPQSGFISNAKERYTGLTTNYVDLNHSIGSLADCIVWVNYVKQDATNLTLTTSTRITLGATLVASDIVEVAYLGKAVATQTPDTGTVTNDMLAGSIDLTSKVTGALPQANIADQAINEAKLQVSNAPTNGYMLTAQSGNTGGLTWATAPSSGLVQVSRTIVSSNVNDIQLDNCFSSTYNNYLLLIRNVVPVNDEVDFMLRLNNGGTQMASSKYCYMNEFLDNGGGSQGHFSGDNNTEFEMAHDVDNESWKGGANFILHIQTNLGDTSNMSTFTMSGTGSFVADSGIQYSSHFGGTFKDSGRPSATGVDVFFNSGDIARGEISCYGVTIV